ncbi:MAG: FAD-dependent oxidoreductase [Pseudomonadota bacterium]
MNSQNIAVIGAGISGLSAAWLLSKNHNVTLFEQDARLGGHSNTVDMDVDGTTVPVDTGFIVFNSATYPNLLALFDHLDVPKHPTEMSFAASLNSGGYEYSGGTYFGLVAQPSNVVLPSHWRMIADILRFFRQAPEDLKTMGDDETLVQYLARRSYSDAFTERHLLPMAAAIWSSKLGDMRHYPARAFIRFFQNHGLLQVEGRPKWGTVQGGSRVYVAKLLADSQITTRIAQKVVGVRRTPIAATVTTEDGTSQSFDHVVIASHADQALAMLEDPDHAERSLLGAFGYEQNHAVLHRDPRFMPKRRAAWASWNYLDFAPKGSGPAADEDLCLTYWMNSLQNLPTKEDVFVTLNPPENCKIENVAARFDYAHPVFDPKAMAAQRELWSLQGVNRTWYCGAHFGAGFHEDGLQSGLAVAEQLGGMARPWSVANPSSRIYVHEQPALAQAAE